MKDEPVASCLSAVVNRVMVRYVAQCGVKHIELITSTDALKLARFRRELEIGHANLRSTKSGSRSRIKITHGGRETLTAAGPVNLALAHDASDAFVASEDAGVPKILLQAAAGRKPDRDRSKYSLAHRRSRRRLGHDQTLVAATTQNSRCARPPAHRTAGKWAKRLGALSRI